LDSLFVESLIKAAVCNDKMEYKNIILSLAKIVDDARVRV
jgi:hypothetical protein